MKLLYIGHYNERSGWSNAAINTIESISTTDIDIVCRSIKLNNTQYIPQNIIPLEQKDLNNIDYCIQNVLPHHIIGTNKFKKNIAYFVHEFDSINNHHWYQNLELVDEIWVPNNGERNNLINDGFKHDKVKVIPYAFNITKYNDNKQRIIFNDKDHTFKFYFICELDDRKNIESIIRCFHSEFHSSEPVSLVLKIKKVGVSPEALRQHVSKLCDEIKSQLRIYNNIDTYNHEIIITEDFTDEQMKILHLSCDCYIGPTHGEGWGIPSFEAMCYGNTPICSNEGGPKDYIDPNNKNTGWLIDGMMGICTHQNAAFNDIFTGLHHWFIPNELEIKRAMRYYYENRKDKKNIDGLKQAEKFSYQNVGTIIRKNLNV